MTAENVTPIPKRRRRVDGFAPEQPEHLEHLEQTPPEPTPAERYLDALRAKMLTGSALLTIPEPDPLVQGLLFRETTSMIVGPPKMGKTFLSVDLAASVITGREWQGLTTFGKGRPVVYLAGEGRRGVMRRFAAWCDHHGHDLNALVEHLHLLPGGLSLHHEADRWPIVELLTELRPVLVIVDTLARHARGAEENSARDMGQFVESLDAIAESTTAHVCVIHHSGKNAAQGARGSSALLGAVDTELTVSGGPPQGTVKVTAQRDADPLPQWSVKYVPAGTNEDGEHLSLVAIPTTAPMPTDHIDTDQVLSILRELIGRGTRGVTLQEWHRAVVDELNPEGDRKGFSLSTFKRKANGLERAGLVVNLTPTEKTHRWSLPDERPALID